MNTKNVFDKFSGAGVSPAFGGSRPLLFTGETPVRRRPEARATIFQTRSKGSSIGIVPALIASVPRGRMNSEAALDPFSRAFKGGNATPQSGRRLWLGLDSRA